MDDSIWKNAAPIDIPEEALKQTLEQEVPMSDRIFKVMRNSPPVVVGVLGFCAVCGIGAYKWKSKTIKPTIYLVQLRLAAQSAIIGCIALGALYPMYSEWQSKKKE